MPRGSYESIESRGREASLPPIALLLRGQRELARSRQSQQRSQAAEAVPIEELLRQQSGQMQGRLVIYVDEASIISLSHARP